MQRHSATLLDQVGATGDQPTRADGLALQLHRELSGEQRPETGRRRRQLSGIDALALILKRLA
jgi:hypothetical protein